MRVPARNARLTDIVPPATYGRAYGFERAMDNLGAIGGPLLAIGLINLFSIRTAIAVSVIPGLTAAIAILYTIRHIPTPKRTQPAPIRLRVRGVLTPPFGRVFAGITAFELGNCAATLLILRATQLLATNHDKTRAAALALVLYVAYNTAATIVSFPAGHLADKTRPTLPGPHHWHHRVSCRLRRAHPRHHQPRRPRRPVHWCGDRDRSRRNRRTRSRRRKHRADNTRLSVRASRRHPIHRKPCRIRHRRHHLDNHITVMGLCLPHRLDDHRNGSPRHRTTRADTVLARNLTSPSTGRPFLATGPAGIR